MTIRVAKAAKALFITFFWTAVVPALSAQAPLPLTLAPPGIVGTAFNSSSTAPERSLVGFKISMGEVLINAVPLFDGADGASYGRTIAKKETVLLSGHVVGGLEVYEGLWYGALVVKGLKVLWLNPKTGQIRESKIYGIGPEKNDKGRWSRYSVPQGSSVVGIHGFEQRGEFVNRLGLVVGGVRPQGPSTSVQIPTVPVSPGRPDIQQPTQPQVAQPTAPVVTVPQAAHVEGDARFTGMPTGRENISLSHSSFEREVLKLVNTERSKARLAPLEWNEDLARAARYHAADMADNDYFLHDTYDRREKSLIKVGGTFDRILRFSQTGHAENIAWSQKTPAEVMASWMGSAGHRANILSPRSSQMGVGYIKGYWVQVFGK